MESTILFSSGDACSGLASIFSSAFSFVASLMSFWKAIGKEWLRQLTVTGKGCRRQNVVPTPARQRCRQVSLSWNVNLTWLRMGGPLLSECQPLVQSHLRSWAFSRGHRTLCLCLQCSGHIQAVVPFTWDKPSLAWPLNEQVLTQLDRVNYLPSLWLVFLRRQTCLSSIIYHIYWNRFTYKSPHGGE